MASASPTLDRGWVRVTELEGTSLGDYLDDTWIAQLRRHKGGVGRAIEATLGIAPGERGRDFIDGELKTYHADPDGFPNESVFIQRFADVDPYLRLPRFVDTPLYAKIRRLLLVGVSRAHPDPAHWQLTRAIHVAIEPGGFWFDFVEASYQDIIKQLSEALTDGERFRTFTSAYMQIRVKDSRPYTPVHSALLGRQVSDKGLGFYFTRRFIRECVEEAIACG